MLVWNDALWQEKTKFLPKTKVAVELSKEAIRTIYALGFEQARIISTQSHASPYEGYILWRRGVPAGELSSECMRELLAPRLVEFGVRSNFVGSHHCRMTRRGKNIARMIARRIRAAESS